MKKKYIKNLFCFYCCFFISISETHSICPPSINEVRLGLARHGVKSRLVQSSKEKGYDFALSILSGPLDMLKIIGAPRTQLGFNANYYRSTDTAYTGFIWDFPVGAYFLEGGLGFCIHNGAIKNTETPRKIALGSRFLFREHIGLGYRLSKKMSVLIQIEHMSNARLAQPNPGLTSFGIHISYGI